jgi:polysaccharide export outer membrane protein
MIFRLTTLVAFVVALFALPKCSVAQEAAGAALAPGDQLRIVVYKGEELSGLFTISSAGTILHPLYRDIRVTGVPMSTVEDRIRTFLLKYQTNPQFVLEPLVRVVVGGEVRSPNVYSVPPETTFAQVIALAGGPTERASLRKVSVIRDRQEIRMDLRRPDSDAMTLQIRSGDQIILGRSAGPATNYIGAFASSVAAIAAVLSILLR